MRAAIAPWTYWFAPSPKHLAGAFSVSLIVLLLIAAPPPRRTLQPGETVAYSEDQLGRPWRIVRPYEFRRFLIRNGEITAIADADELSPYRGYEADQITLEKAGEPWERVVKKIEADRD